MRRPLSVLIGTSLALAGLLLAGCGGSGGTSSSGTDAGAPGPTITIGYSAWPGWFPLKVAEAKGLFAAEGVNVTLKYFTDYTASIDALNAGSIDANAETLNDTIASVASGTKLKIVLNTDFSAGNDAVIVDKSITDIAQLKGKKIAAEAGVVDHYLLLQGLAANGMKPEDIAFRGLPTDAAAAAFASGQFDGVAVFAPFTLEALKRAGSHVLFSSKDYPGAIPDHIVFSDKVVAAQPADIQKIVNAWYKALAYIQANPADATAIMAKQAGISDADYTDLASGTEILTPAQALAAFTESADPTSLPTTAKKINPFLVDSGLTKQPAALDGLFDATFTKAYVDSVPKT